MKRVILFIYYVQTSIKFHQWNYCSRKNFAHHSLQYRTDSFRMIIKALDAGRKAASFNRNMFRCCFTRRHKRTLTTAIASPLTRQNTNDPFLFDLQNPKSHVANSPIRIGNLIHLHKKSKSRRKAPSLVSPLSNSSFDISEHLVSKYRDSCSLQDAKLFHLQITKQGVANDVFWFNTLINVYVRVGDMVSASKLFGEMHERNSISWACIVSGYTQNGMFNEAFYMFKEMVSAGFLLNNYAVGSVLRACQEAGPSGLKFGMQIHGLVLKSKHTIDGLVSNLLISMYGSCLTSATCAWRVFEEMETRDLISWNSIISVYSKRGDAVAAFELFSRMQMEGFGCSLKPNEYTFGSLITAAYSSANTSLYLLEQMLARVKKSGLLSDLYVGSAFVSGYANFGLSDCAMKIFEQMSQRNTVSMNGLMVGLVRQKRGEEATEVFREMRNLVDTSLDSYVILLSAFAEFAVLEEGRRKGKEVHGYLIRRDSIEHKVAIGNGLISMYAKFGAIDDSRSVFRFMMEKDSVSWNTMISGLDQNECFEEAIMNFSAMRRDAIKPSNFSLISTLSSCASLGWIMLGQQIHGEGLKMGFDSDVSVSNALLALYADTGYLSECLKVFFSMLEYDQVSWNTVIGALADPEMLVSESVNYYLDMMRAGWHPNSVTFINILTVASSISLGKLGYQIHAQVIKYCVANDTTIDNALLAYYGKCGEMDECEKIFSRMSERKDDVSWNSMISGYIHNELLPRAMGLVWFMMQRGQRLDCFTFATVLSACASVATLERGMEVHACGIRACLESDVVVGSALVDMYSKCGRIDYASRFFYMMPVRNLYSWNSMISGYARHGHGDKALCLFSQMKLDGPLPDHVTFVGVLSACSHAGLVDEGFCHFQSMSQVYGLAPRIEHYSCMVDLLGRAGELDKIERFINKMPMKPNILFWRTVLGACCRANGGKTDLGRKAADMLFEMEPQNAVNYVLLANMYASGGKWEDVARARRAMRKAEVKKEAGCSWVTMKDGIHVFVAGDKSHPEKDLIYKKLKELNQEMRDAGYVPQTKYALFDLEQESKEELLRYHSEKIAVAFVLTRNSRLPIRIMKNLRVCGDCHSAFKFISKIVGRQIVLRDSNRFHHFNDGLCSCGDYW